MICPICGSEFKPHHWRQKYCNSACGYIAHLERKKNGPHNPSKYSPEELLFLEKRTLENIVYTHLEELQATHRTRERPNVSQSVYRSLNKAGFILREQRNLQYFFSLTPECLKLIEEVQSS